MHIAISDIINHQDMKVQQSVMKPQDLLILLKIISIGNDSWNQKAMAEALCISQSEVSESIARSKFAGLLDNKGKKVMRLALMDFLQYAIKYVFPQKQGVMVRGIPTSHSASPLKEEIISDEQYVWPYSKGTVRGHSIVPFYPSVVEASLKDVKLYEILSLVEALRVGRAREREIAINLLKQIIVHGK